jgi:hypothetical protein
MFAEFNYERFPIVNVLLNDVIDEDDFNDFLGKWLKLYIDERNFILIFDTRNVNNVPIKYSIRMADFIKKLKKRPYHYLQKSIIILNNEHVKQLLNVIFKLQTPVAPVYLITDDTYINKLLSEEITCEEMTNIICIMPGKSYLPFL